MSNNYNINSQIGPQIPVQNTVYVQNQNGIQNGFIRNPSNVQPIYQPRPQPISAYPISTHMTSPHQMAFSQNQNIIENKNPFLKPQAPIT